jgi:hypothetical protein
MPDERNRDVLPLYKNPGLSMTNTQVQNFISTIYFTEHVPTIEDVDRIAALKDAVIRNLQITQCYHELSAVLRERLGGNANWCTFATWASKQAGQSIRKDDLTQALRRFIAIAPEPGRSAIFVGKMVQALGAKTNLDEIVTAIWDSLNLPKAIDRTSQAVGAGNNKVFAEIGREFARFNATCLNDPAPNMENILNFCAGLIPGDPPDGQAYLRLAFFHLYEALFEPDDCRRAELMLLSNTLIGYHEQTRLQPEIRNALDGPFLDEAGYLQRLLTRLFPRTAALLLISRHLFFHALGRPPLLELAIHALLTSVLATMRVFVTETLMTITIPKDVRLRLWRDLTGMYPADLQQITNSDLRLLLEQIDPTGDSLQDSGAVDWSNLSDRLHYIVDLFRLYQQDADLFDPPYSPDQIIELKAGRLPAGSL